MYKQLIGPISFLTLNLFLFFYTLFFKSFPPWLIMLNVLSMVLFIACWLPLKKTSRIKHYILDLTIILILFFLAISIRLWNIEEITPGMWGDEVTVGMMSEKVWRLPEFTPFVEDNYGHPTPLLYLGGVFIEYMGRSLTSVRMVSVLFGATDVALLYIVCRQFFTKKTSVITSLIFTYSYTHIILSRLAYEMTAAIFFELLVILFLYHFWKSAQIRWLIFTGIALGLGMYTYLGFRTFAIVSILFTLVLIWQKFKHQRFMFLFSVCVFLIAGFISCMPLISYAILYPEQIQARTVSVSVFHQNLPLMEVLKEIQGSTWRSLFVLIGTFDPNLRQNPAHTFMFNPLILSISALGLFVLCKKHFKMFLVTLLFLLTAFINDIFSIEFIPEFHFYGSGHPNTLRLFGLIPIIFMLLAVGVQKLGELMEQLTLKQTSRNIYISLWTLILTLTIIWIDISSYFFQPPGLYNYTYNGVPQLKIAEGLNQSGRKDVYLSSSFFLDQRIQYFTDPSITLKEYKIERSEFSLNELPQNTLIVINPQENIDLANEIVRQINVDPTLPITLILNPWQHVEAIIVNTGE